MLGLKQQHDVLVEPLKLHDVARERPLALGVKLALERPTRRLTLGLHDVGQKRDHHVLDLREEGIVEGAARAMLELVQPDVIRVFLRVLVASDGAHGAHDTVHVRLERRPVIGGLGAQPHVVGLAGESREVCLLVCRDIHQLCAAAAQHLDLRELHGREQLRVGLKAVEQSTGLLRAQQLVVLLLQDGHGLGAVARRLGRVDGAAVRHDAAQGIAVGVKVTLEVIEGRLVCLGIIEGSRRGHLGCARDAQVLSLRRRGCKVVSCVGCKLAHGSSRFCCVRAPSKFSPP